MKKKKKVVVKVKKVVPRKKKEEHFVSFYSLVDHHAVGSWGRMHESEQEAKQFKESPYDNALIFSYLAHILNELIEIRWEIKKKRTIE